MRGVKKSSENSLLFLNNYIFLYKNLDNIVSDLREQYRRQFKAYLFSFQMYKSHFQKWTLMTGFVVQGHKY